MSHQQNSLAEYLRQVTDALDEAGIKYALCGGLALAIHGHPRFTQDIDLLVEPDNLQQLVQVVKPIGFVIPAHPMTLSTPAGDIEIRRMSAAAESQLVTLDILIVNPTTQPAWDTRRAYRWGDGTLTCVSKEGLAHLKRISARPQDKIDLETLGMDDEELG